MSQIELYNQFLDEWSEQCFQYVLDNPSVNITWEIVQAYPLIDWNYLNLSSNPNITWEIVEANPDKPWNYDRLSSNPNITRDIVDANPDKPWNYFKLSKNKMNFAKEQFIRSKFQEWFKRSKLKEELTAKLWHPKNFEKFKYYDPEMFGNEEEDEN
jgi:hypothetical protein